VKRFIAVLSSLLVLPAFAEVVPVYYDDVIEYTDDMIDESAQQPVEEETTQNVAQKPTAAKRNVAGRSTSRAISAGSANKSGTRTNTSTRVVSTSPRNAQKTQRGTISRTTRTPTGANRVQTTTATRSRGTTVTSRAAAGSTRTNVKNKPVTARVSATGNVISGTRTNTSAIDTPTVMLSDSADAIYNPSETTSARSATSRRSTTRTSLTLGAVSSSSTSLPKLTSEDIAETTTTLDAVSDLTEYCKAQYAQCMDNYCNILDDAQGRCSCSSNIQKYQETEKTLAEISEKYKDVIQKIKYIGLTANQIATLFTETEAEIAMSQTYKEDQTKLKTDLEDIRKMIVDVSDIKKSNQSSSENGLFIDTSGLFDFSDSESFDFSSFLNENKSASQLRGAALFKTATQRCKTAVLDSCTDQGIDANVITNSYDLMIDKQCIEYTRALNEENAEMRRKVRNAQIILQQARLMLAQQKNTYDLRGCVAALDECMQDEYVCGDDYKLCLDPTGKYLANGEIVKGGTPGIAGGSPVTTKTLGDISDTKTWVSCGMYGLYSTWDYDNPKLASPTSESCSGKNAWGSGATESLNAYIDEKVKAWKEKYKDTTKQEINDMATFLLSRVGYVEKNNKKGDKQNYGMCSSVLEQCQDYTFEYTNKKQQDDKYLPDNEVIRQYLAMALTKIKLEQDSILADYAESCWSDVYSCLSTNSFDENYPTNTASKTAVNACRGEIASCMSVTGYQPSDNATLTLSAMSDWVTAKLISCPENTMLKFTPTTGTTPSKTTCTPCGTATCIISNSSIVPASVGCEFESNEEHLIQLVSAGGQATECVCPDEFTAVKAEDVEEQVSFGSEEIGNSTSIRCKYNGTGE